MMMNRKTATSPRRLKKNEGFLTVAITGIPGSGKSVVLEEFRRAGFYAVDADELSRREFYKKENLRRIKKIFGVTDRRQIAEKVFSNSLLRRKLERIIHPGVIKKLKQLVSSLKKRKAPLAAEVPLLFEKNLDKLFDFSVVVFAPVTSALSRLVKSKKISPFMAQKMIKAHLPSSEKARRANFVLTNKSSINQLRHSSKHLALVILRSYPS